MADVLMDKRADGVALITLNRPASMNATGGTLSAELSEFLRECEADRTVRCVALTGEGRAFCAGGDVKKIQGQLQDAEEAPLSPPALLEQQINDLQQIHTGTVL